MKKSLIITLGLAIMFALSSITMGITGAVITARADSSPVELTNTSIAFKQVAAGYDYSLALDITGKVWAWGTNNYGQLGNGTSGVNIFVNAPTRIQGLSEIKAIAAGYNHSMALDITGKVWAWGNNSNGQLGDGTTTQRLTPVQIPGLPYISEISARGSNSMALGSGTVWAWGSNGSGQLGDGTTVDKRTPTQMLGVDDAISIKAGSHSMVLKSDYTVWTCGSNNEGQLGNGASGYGANPTLSQVHTDAYSISSGKDHSMARNSDGTVWVWGDNEYGQLGDNTSVNKSTPIQVPGLTGVTAIAAGDTYSMAIKSDKTVWAWGRNASGQLGDGTMLTKRIPVKAQGLTDVIVISAGDTHSMAVQSDGTAWAWGGNYYGQIGNGLYGNLAYGKSNTPIKVIDFSVLNAMANIDEALGLLENEYNALDASLNGPNGQVAQLETLKDQYETLEGLINGTGEDDPGILAALEAVQLSISTLEGIVNGVNGVGGQAGRLTALENALNGVNGQDGLLAKYNALKSRLDAITNEDGSLDLTNDEAFSALSEEVKDLDDDLWDEVERLDGLIEDMPTNDEMNDAIQTALSNLSYVSQTAYETEIEELRGTLSDLGAANTDLKNDYYSVKDELEKLKNELAEIKNNSNDKSNNSSGVTFYILTGVFGALAIAGLVPVLVMFIKKRKLGKAV